MVQWVFESARKARGVDEVVVATDSDEIHAAVHRFGGRSILTRKDHQSGTDRVAEVASKLEAETIVNVQGDEPLLPVHALETLIERFLAQGNGQSVASSCGQRAICPMGTLVSPVTDRSDLENPARAKVVCRADGRALFFSRSPVPFDRDGTRQGPYFRHLGVYIYTRRFLLDFASLAPSPLELAERLEQLRARECGYDILTVPVPYEDFGVDTPEDLESMRRRVISLTHQTDRASTPSRRAE